MEPIRSLQNEQVKRWARLHTKKERDLRKQFLIEGEHLLEEAKTAGIVETIISSEQRKETDIPVVYVSEAVLKKLSSSVSGASVIGVCRMKEEQVPEWKRVLMLDCVQDPGNLGTLIRTAVSFGYDAVYLSEDCCDGYNEKTIRSTQGALFHIPVIRTDLRALCEAMKRKGVTVVAAALDASVPMRSVAPSEKMAFILGNEGNGIRRQLQEEADIRMRIEMSGFESLNVAVAGGILMYHFS